MKNTENKPARLFSGDLKASLNTFGGNPEDRTFLSILREYMTREILENNLKDSTRDKYDYFYANITEFLHQTGRAEMKLSEMRVRIAEEMRAWILNTRNCGLTHASRHVEMCKRVMSWAVLMEYAMINPIQPVKARRDKIKDVVHLEPNELQMFVNARFASRVLQEMADLYIFQAHTGLSYADLYTYQIIEDGGKLWLVNNRGKNDSAYHVPLFPEAKAIHDKYNGKLPHYVCGYYNRGLKEIAAFLGINKHLTTHTARKTFATLLDQRGVSPKTIAMCLGNTVQVVEQHYVKKSRKRTEAEFSRLGIEPVKAA